MARLLAKVGGWCYRAKWVVIVTWLVVLGALAGIAASMNTGFSQQFSISDTPTQRATEIYEENFPDAGDPLLKAGITLVFAALDGETLADPENSAAIDQVVGYLQQNFSDMKNTERFGNPVVLNPMLQAGLVQQMTAQGMPQAMAEADAYTLRLLNDDATIGYTTFDIDVPRIMDVTDEQRQTIMDAAALGREAGIEVEVAGSGFSDPVELNRTSELIGLFVAAIVLIVTFGSLVAAGMPLFTAVIGVAVGSLLTTIGTVWWPINNTTPALSVMLGLAVGIDYSLFILARYRRELQHRPPAAAIAMAVGTAGSAVVFAGLTVIVALLALALANITFLTLMGISAAVTVAMAVLVAITLIPAVLGALGKHAFGAQIWKPRIRTTAAGYSPRGRHAKKLNDYEATQLRTLGGKWVRFVHRFPALVLLVAVVGLGALSIPATRLHLSLPADTTADLGTTQRTAADLLTEGFGAGINSPFLVVVDAHDVDAQAQPLQPFIAAQAALDPQAVAENPQLAAARASYQYVIQRYEVTQNVENIQIVGLSEDGLAAQMLLTPTTAPEATATEDLVTNLREVQPQIEQATGVETGITGLMAIQQDITHRLSDVMPLYLAIVVGLAILLLMVIFRSVLLPLYAGLGFLLSVGAAFGVTVLFWQEGLWDLVHTPGPIIAFMPIFLIGVCFGLAMDYQVFLGSAMREHYTHNQGKPQPGSPYTATEESIIQGFSASARVVTAAALIMISVFAAFITQPLPFVKIFGFALGAGVLFDAFVIRMGLVPAAMFLSGDKAWWMPKWLGKILPRLDVEGTALERETTAPKTTPVLEAAPRPRAITK